MSRITWAVCLALASMVCVSVESSAQRGATRKALTVATKQSQKLVKQITKIRLKLAVLKMKLANLEQRAIDQEREGVLCTAFLITSPSDVLPLSSVLRSIIALGIDPLTSRANSYLKSLVTVIRAFIKAFEELS